MAVPRLHRRTEVRPVWRRVNVVLAAFSAVLLLVVGFNVGATVHRGAADCPQPVRSLPPSLFLLCLCVMCV